MVSGITGLYWKYTIYHISIFIFMPFHLANNAAEVAVADAIEPIERVDKLPHEKEGGGELGPSRRYIYCRMGRLCVYVCNDFFMTL